MLASLMQGSDRYSVKDSNPINAAEFIVAWLMATPDADLLAAV